MFYMDQNEILYNQIVDVKFSMSNDPSILDEPARTVSAASTTELTDFAHVKLAGDKIVSIEGDRRVMEFQETLAAYNTLSVASVTGAKGEHVQDASYTLQKFAFKPEV